MMQQAFGENLTTAQLSRLPSESRLAFAAACAQRCIANYATFFRETHWGNPQAVESALHQVWRWCLGESQPPTQHIRALADQLEDLAPDAEDFTSLFVSSAQDAVFAVCCLLDYCCDKDVTRLVEATRYATDSIDLYVQEVLELDPQDPLLEAKILAHPLMQQELERQNRDMTALAHSADREAIVVLRDTALVETTFTLQ
jgi:uncharacterized protein YjaG (DUF416 family)